MGSRSNWESEEGSNEIEVTAKREKCAVMWCVAEVLLKVWMMEVVSGSRVVLEEGTRIPRRIGVRFGGAIGASNELDGRVKKESEKDEEVMILTHR